MTTPSSDAFEYNDDSVVARVAIDVPSQAITDISQLSTAMAAMRTQLEAISRSQGDWLDYLQQVPVIAERANQAYRDQITQLERIAYIQNELGGSAGGGGGNVSPQTPMRSAGGGAGYSTAAPSGFRDDFAGKTEGMGGGNRGAANSLTDVSGKLQALAGEDPRMLPNAASARGQAVNPSLLGLIGGAAGLFFGQNTGGTGGRGQDAPGRESPQPQSGRTADGQPVPSQGGQPEGSAPQGHPAPSDQSGSGFQQLRDSMWGEVQKGVHGSRVGQILGAMAPSMVDKVFGGGGGGGKPGDGSNVGDQIPLFGLPGGAKGGGIGSKLLKGAGYAGLGLTALKMSQDVGERMTRLNALGSEEGGDYATGLKEDIHARMLGLDPSITSDQARKASQIAMSAGLQGDSRDQLRDMMINNFKDMGVAFGDSAMLAMTNMRGQKLTDENMLATRSSTDATLNVMKELSGDGGNSMALSERLEELKKLTAVLNSLGSGQGNIERSAIGWQEGYKDSTALRGAGSKIIGQTMASGTLLSTVGNKMGVTGYLPNAMPAALEAAGLDDDEITNMAAAEAAKHASSQPKYLNRVAVFQSLMAEQGVELDWPQAKDLYDRVSPGKERPDKKANKTIAGKGQKNQGNWNPIGVIKDLFNAKGPEDMADAITGRHAPSDNAERVLDSFAGADRIPGDQFAPSGQRPRQLPQSAEQAQQRTFSSKGVVSGEVRIVVDQQGRVSAPQVIQLSGTQKAVNAGVGSAQLNNAPASESPGYNPFGGGR